MTSKNTILYFKDAKSDKQYNASLEKSGNKFVVNFAYGKRDGNLKEGTKTTTPVAYEKALAIYDKLVKSKTDKGYIPENSVTKENSAEIEKSDSEDLTNFNLLKKLLKPFEEQLELPEGIKLKDVKPTYDSKSEYTADCQRVIQLGLVGIELNDVFGWDYTIENFLFEQRDFTPDDFSSWHWLDVADSDKIEFLDEYFYYIGDFPTGDGFFQIKKGIHKGKLAFMEHGWGDEIEEVLDEIDKEGSVDEIIKACKFIEISEDFENLEDYFIKRIKSIKKKSTFDAKKIKALLKKSTTLNLSDKKLDEIPQALFDFPEITELNLSKNEIKVIPAEIEKLSNLKVLNLSDNYLKKIDDNLAKLNKLKSLDISDNNMDEIPLVIFKLVQLEFLNISEICSANRDFVSMPQEVINLKKLKSFKLSGLRYRITDYPEFKHLEGNPIDLNPIKAAYSAYLNKQLRAVSYIIKNSDSQIIKKVLDNQYNPETKEMSLRYYRLPFIPKELLDYDIKILNLSNCKIGESKYIDPSDLKLLKQKKKSDLKKTTVLNSLTDLEELILGNNDFHELPNINALKKLRLLDISSNDLIHFTMPDLPLLEDLNIEYNSLKELPDLRRLQNLKKLDIASNDLERFAIAPLQKLEELHISSSELIEFPTSIFTLKNLKHLNVSYAFESDEYKPKIEDFKKLSALKHLTVFSQDVFEEGSKQYKMLANFLPSDCEIE